jgi:hypothetical protein
VIDLEQVAEANAPRLDADFQELLSVRSAEESSIIINFSQWVRDVCKITINVKLYVIFDLINNGRYLNMYEAADQYAQALGVARDEVLRSWLGAFYERRITFDRAFQDGEKFIYGALSASGGGLREYDPYCVQLIDQFYASAAALAFLPGDSIGICFSAGGEFNEAGTCAMITPHSHRHILAACKNWSDALSSAMPNWPQLMNTKANYIEALFIGNITLASIDRVQILKSEYDRMISLVLRTIGRKIESAEHTLVYCFRAVLLASRNHQINFEVVP